MILFSFSLNLDSFQKNNWVNDKPKYNTTYVLRF